MKKQKIFAAVYAALLLFGCFGSLLPNFSGFSAALSGREGAFGSRIEQYLRDNLPLHETLVGARTGLKLLGGLREIDGIFYADYSLIENLTLQDISVSENNCAALVEYAAALPASPVAMLLPSACAIEQYLLPAAAVLFDQQSWLYRTNSLLSNCCTTIDAYGMLEEHCKDRLFYRTDPRMTQLAGYRLYALLAGSLGYEALPFSEFSTTPLAYGCYGSLYPRWSNSGVHADTVTAYLPLDESRSYRVVHTGADGIAATYYSLYPAEAAARGTGIDTVLGGSSPQIELTAYGSPGRSLLVLGDAQSLCLLPFLALHYSHITLLTPADCTGEMLAQAAAKEYDQTLISFSVPTLLNRDIATGLQVMSAAIPTP